MGAWLSKAWKWVCVALALIISIIIPLYGYERWKRKRAEKERDNAVRSMEIANDRARIESEAAARHREVAVRMDAERRRAADRLRDLREYSERAEAEIDAATDDDLADLWDARFGDD